MSLSPNLLTLALQIHSRVGYLRIFSNSCHCVALSTKKIVSSAAGLRTKSVLVLSCLLSEFEPYSQYTRLQQVFFSLLFLAPHEKDRQFSTLSNKGPPSRQPFSILWSNSYIRGRRVGRHEGQLLTHQREGRGKRGEQK